MAKKLIPINLYPRETGMTPENVKWGIDNNVFEMKKDSKGRECITHEGAITLRKFNEAKNGTAPKKRERTILKKKNLEVDDLVAVSTAIKNSKYGSTQILIQHFARGVMKGTGLYHFNASDQGNNQWRFKWPGEKIMNEINTVTRLDSKDVSDEEKKEMISDIMRPEPEPEPEPTPEPEPEPAPEPSPAPPIPQPTPSLTQAIPEFVVRVVLDVPQPEKKAEICRICDETSQKAIDKINELEIHQVGQLGRATSENKTLNHELKKTKKQLETSLSGLLMAKENLKKEKQNAKNLQKQRSDLKIELKELRSVRRKASRA